jgi:hypothetical protein
MSARTGSANRLQLIIYDPERNILTNQLTLSIPHTPSDGQRIAAHRGFRLYLLNDSGTMARYIQVEMYVQAVFLAYSYHGSTPLLVDYSGSGRWTVDKSSANTFRCFFEGGADLVCHTDRPYDLGYVSIRVPHGEADGRVVPLNIRYEIAAEDHSGEGRLTVSLQAEGTTASVFQQRVDEVGGQSQGPTTVFDMRGQRVEHQVNVAGDYVDRRSTVVVGDGNVVGDHSSSHVVKGRPPAADRATEDWDNDDDVSLRRQLAEARANLRLIEERESSHVLSTDVPLELVKEKRRLQQRIADLEARLGDTFPKA